jgi:hypothetical protein
MTGKLGQAAEVLETDFKNAVEALGVTNIVFVNNVTRSVAWRLHPVLSGILNASYFFETSAAFCVVGSETVPTYQDSFVRRAAAAAGKNRSSVFVVWRSSNDFQQSETLT